MKLKKVPEELKTIKPQREQSFIQQMKLKKELSRKSLKKQTLQTLAFVKYKHDQILSIIDSIDEVTQMFLDMKVLIDNQSLLINDIVENCQQAQDYTNDTVELIQTSKHLQKSSHIVCFIYLFLVCKLF